MKLEILDNSKNYACSVVKIGKVFDIDGADRIKRVVVNGNDVVVSNSVKEGDNMLYFVSGTKLNHEFCHNNNLYDKSEENKDTEQRGFISFRQKRVKAVKLRGIISDGMLMPMTALDTLVKDASLNVGDEFTTINGIVLCEKWISPEIVKQQNQNVGKTKSKAPKLKNIMLEEQFNFHTDTAHFAKNIHKFNLETEVIITRKLHGSSLILANVLVNKQLTRIDKIKKFFNIPVLTEEYGKIFSSGKPKSRLPKGIVSDSFEWNTKNPSFYSENIWVKAFKEYSESLEKGISIYGEIVGKGIQGEGYTYNQDFGVYIYRITYTTPDNKVIEYSWEQMKAYCDKYGMKTVPLFFKGKLKEILTQEENILQDLKDMYLDKSFPDCKIDEGICIRKVEDDEIFKLKSPKFILGESNNQENGVEEFES